MVRSILIDSHKFASQLERGGFTREQAETLTKALRDSDINHLSTKGDIQDLEIKLSNKIITVVGLGVAFLSFLMGLLKIS